MKKMRKFLEKMKGKSQKTIIRIWKAISPKQAQYPIERERGSLTNDQMRDGGTIAAY